MSAPPPILRLRGDNFTPSARTPWGGGRVAAWKRALGIAAEAPLGESWEVSFGPELPSRTEGDDVPLLERVRQDLTFYLGAEAPRGTSALLVKLLDAGAPLSVQIHPTDDDPRLLPDQSGKPECWYVAAADPGAFILFGLTDAASPAAMRRALDGGGEVSKLLARWEVEVGDFFVVPPGTPHAIGAGVTVVEPQRLAPGKRGVTYRYWDWNRRYDATGRPDPHGEPRELHVDDALAVTDWEKARGSLLGAHAMRRTGRPALQGQLSVLSLSGPRGASSPREPAPAPIPFPIRVERLAGTGRLALPAASVARSLTMLEGELELTFAGVALRARRAESLLLPAAADIELAGEGALAVLASIDV